MQGDELAVDVRLRHRVGIGYGHAAHARAGDHLRCIGAYAAQPDHQHVGAAQQVEFLVAQQQGGAFQPVIIHG